MKSLLLYILLLSVAVCACTGDRSNASFQNIEAFMGADPDSALALATAFEPHGKAEHARRALLIAKAADKAYHLLPDDSLIRIAAGFYHGHNDSLEVQSLYYLGNHYVNYENYEVALNILRSSEEKAKKQNELFYLAMTQRLISDIYSTLYVLDRAEHYIIEARKNFEKAGKHNHTVWCELLVALALADNQKPDSAICILSNAERPDDINYMSEWHRIMAHAQYKAFNYNETIKNLDWIRQHMPSHMECLHYSILADCYLHAKDRDAAEQNLSIAKRISATWNDSIFINMLQSKLWALDGNMDKAYSAYKEASMDLSEKYDKLLTHPYYDSIDKSLQQEKNLYLQQAEAEKEKRTYITLIAILSILIATSIIIIIIKSNRAKTYRIELLRNQANMLNADLSALNTKATEAHIEARSIFTEHINLLNKICGEWYLLPETKGNDKLLSAQIDKLISTINSDDNLEQFETLINKYRDNLIEKICKACPKLTKENKKLVIYMSLGLSHESICFLMNKTKSTLAVYRHRLKKSIENSDLMDKEQTIQAIFGCKSEH